MGTGVLQFIAASTLLVDVQGVLNIFYNHFIIFAVPRMAMVQRRNSNRYLLSGCFSMRSMKCLGNSKK